MKITELTTPTKEMIAESLETDAGHTFSKDTLQEIAESVSTTQSQGMSVKDALEWLRNA